MQRPLVSHRSMNSESRFSESVVHKAEESFCTAELLLAVTQLCIGTLEKYQKILLGPSS